MDTLHGVTGGRTHPPSKAGSKNKLPNLYKLAPDLFRDTRAFITVDLIDDIKNILKFGGAFASITNSKLALSLSCWNLPRRA